MIEWGSPQNFVWLWSVPVAAAVFGVAEFRRRSRLKRFGDLGLTGRLAVSLDPGRRLAKQALLLASVALLVLGLCQPHFSKKETKVEHRGIDVMIAIDVSNSMLAKDLPPSRLEKAKLELGTLIDKLKGDRVGIVAFAGEAYIQCPLTLDRGAAKLFLSTVHPNLVSLQGTSLSSAIRTALKAFNAKEKDHKALVLLTDGEDHDGKVLEAARQAKEQGVRIFTVGIGTSEGGTIQTQEGFKKDRGGDPVVSKLNEDLLRRVASATDGRYFRATRGELEIESLTRELRGLAKKGFKSDVSVEYTEDFRWFLLPALLCLFAELAISERRAGE